MNTIKSLSLGLLFSLGAGLTACDAPDNDSSARNGVSVDGVYELASGTLMFSESDLEALESLTEPHEQLWALGEGVAIPLFVVAESDEGDEDSPMSMDPQLPSDLPVGTELEIWVGDEEELLESVGSLTVSEADGDVAYGFRFVADAYRQYRYPTRSTVITRLHRRCLNHGGYATTKHRVFKGYRARWIGRDWYGRPGGAYCFR